MKDFFSNLFLKTGINFSDNSVLLKIAGLILGIVFVIFIVGFIMHKVSAKKNKDISFKKINNILCVLLGLILIFGHTDFTQFSKPVVDTFNPVVGTDDESSASTDDEPESKPLPTLSPKATKSTSPSNWKINWQIIKDKKVVKSFKRSEKISFGSGDDYSNVEGIVTFRGDNYRSGASYGFANVKDMELTKTWYDPVGSFNDWCGCGWTGQPLVVRWDDETKAVMNIYPEKKAKKDLVEAIYAALDGKVHFYDMDDGTPTRDSINIGMNFKGAGALDPRGYPLLYLGSGIYYEGKAPGIHIVNLITGKIIYEQSGADSFNYRGWGAFDSSPLVSAETDTLLWGGENGVIYTIKLNTSYDKSKGKISVKPENVAKVRYTTNTGKTLGFESSLVTVGEYVFAADNGGMLFCFNANTMKLIWAQNVRDDINATPVFEWGEDGKGYLYVGTSMEYGGGNSFIFKIDAENGKIIWEKKYSKIKKDKDVSGGILGSPILGKKNTDLEGLIIYPVGKTNNSNAGILVALDTKTGKTVWEKNMSSYAWSSPTAIYTEDGAAYVLTGIAIGRLYLLDPKTGKTLNDISLGGTIESSPVVFENNIILGTRSGVHGIKIS